MLKLAITLMSVLAIVYHFMQNTDDLKKLLLLSWFQITMIATLILLYLIVFTGRSLAVVRKCSSRSLPFLDWFRISTTGRFLSLFVPQVGNVYQGVRLKHVFNVSYTAYLSSKFSLAWIDFVFNLLFAAAVVMVADVSFPLLGMPASVTLMVGAIIIALMPPTALLLLGSMSIRINNVSWMKQKVQALLNITIDNMSDSPYLLKIIGMGLVLFSITCGVLYSCFHALGVDVGVGAIVLFCTLLKLSDHISLTPGNLGIREIIFGLLSNHFGLGVSEGILVSIICRVVFQTEIMLIAVIVNFPKLFRPKDEIA